MWTLRPDPEHGRFELIEKRFLDLGCNLRAEAPESPSLVADDAAPGLPYQFEYGFDVSGTTVRRSISSVLIPSLANSSAAAAPFAA